MCCFSQHMEDDIEKSHHISNHALGWNKSSRYCRFTWSLDSKSAYTRTHTNGSDCFLTIDTQISISVQIGASIDRPDTHASMCVSFSAPHSWEASWEQPHLDACVLGLSIMLIWVSTIERQSDLFECVLNANMHLQIKRSSETQLWLLFHSNARFGIGWVFFGFSGCVPRTTTHTCSQLLQKTTSFVR